MRFDKPSLTVGLMPRFGDGFMSTELPHYFSLTSLDHEGIAAACYSD